LFLGVRESSISGSQQMMSKHFGRRCNPKSFPKFMILSEGEAPKTPKAVWVGRSVKKTAGSCF